MADVQKLKCSECGTEFEFDPNENGKVITSLNESFRPLLEKEMEVTAYLKCPKGHTHPYKVKKEY